jgi:hypothetical protein
VLLALEQFSKELCSSGADVILNNLFNIDQKKVF